MSTHVSALSAKKKRKEHSEPFLSMVFTTVIVVLFLDQLTKYLAVKTLSLGQSISVIKGILHFTLIHNRGAAFGMLKNQTNLFILTSIFAIILIYFNLKKYRKAPSYIISLSLILGGALGNLVDRLFLGYVIDFLDLRIWPVFNIADSAITLGAILLGWSILRSPGHQVTRSP